MFLFVKSIIPIIEQRCSHEQILNELFSSWLMVRPGLLHHYCASWFPRRLCEKTDSWDCPLKTSSPMSPTSLCLQAPG